METLEIWKSRISGSTELHKIWVSGKAEFPQTHVCMHVYMYVCMYTYVHAYFHVCIENYPFLPTCMHKYIHTDSFMYVYIPTYIDTSIDRNIQT